MNKSDLPAWLIDLGLKDYIKFFADDRIDFEVLPDLIEEDLKLLILQGGKLGLKIALPKLEAPFSLLTH